MFKKALLAVLAVVPLTCLAFCPVDLTAPAYTDLWPIGAMFWLVTSVLHPMNVLILMRGAR